MPKAAHAVLPAFPDRSYAEYAARVRVGAVEKALSLRPEEVVEEVARSGLRGRGGAGFPTGKKWASLAGHRCATRSVIGNAAEGEPGTFKDRALLRRSPYPVLEGMRIAAHAIGTNEIWIGIKAGFRAEIARLHGALEEMRSLGLFDGIEIRIVEGPDDYLFGEEKALLNVLEGRAAMPREAHYPPYEWGLNATATSPNPALVNNVETYARVATILREGAASFRATGTAGTPGFLLATLSGDVRRPGVYEVEAGIPLRRLLEDQGGGPLPGRAFKAVLPGLSAGVLTGPDLDAPLDFDALRERESGLGSAGFIVYDDRANMGRVAEMAAGFLFRESCILCPACKGGLREATESLGELFDAEAPAGGAVERALAGARRAPQGNRCWLPVQGSTVVSSLIEKFPQEFRALDAGHAPQVPPVPVPKIVDWDEEAGRFRMA